MISSHGPSQRMLPKTKRLENQSSSGHTTITYMRHIPSRKARTSSITKLFIWIDSWASPDPEVQLPNSKTSKRKCSKLWISQKVPKKSWIILRSLLRKSRRASLFGMKRNKRMLILMTQMWRNWPRRKSLWWKCLEKASSILFLHFSERSSIWKSRKENSQFASEPLVATWTKLYGSLTDFAVELIHATADVTARLLSDLTVPKMPRI